MTELALPCVVVLRPLLEGGYRVYPILVRVLGALFISGLVIAVSVTLWLGALEPIWFIISYFGSLGHAGTSGLILSVISLKKDKNIKQSIIHINSGNYSTRTHNPEKLAFGDINSGNKTTSSVINNDVKLKLYRPEILALQYIESKEPITSNEINSLLLNQNVSITQEELDKLLKLPAVEFNLPIENHTYASFASLVGKPKSRGHYVGVFIFTHIPTGRKYVGSSNSLGFD